MTSPPQPSQPNPSEFARAPRPGDLTPALRILLAGGSLTADQAAAAFQAMMTGGAHHGEIGALLALLATRTPAASEILGAARVMRAQVDRVESSIDPADLVDTAGTGGAPKTFNVSTAAAVVAAACGAKVAKHGNRSRTGRGSAEVLAKLGVDVDAGRAAQRRCLEEAGVCFCFSIHHHPATRHVMPVRQALGFPTIFNLLGPLTNPAGALRQVMGVYERRFLRPIAEALRDLGARRAVVVHSDDGLDEFSIAAPSRVIHVEAGGLREETIDPASLGLRPASLQSVTARDLDHAASMIGGVLDGRDQGPARDMTLLNAAATLIAAGVAAGMPEGLELARRAIDRGDAAKTLTRLIDISKDG